MSTALLLLALLGQTDVQDSHDHSAIKRWPRSTITEKEYRENDTFKFSVRDGATKKVEGRYTLNIYQLPPKVTCKQATAWFGEAFKSQGLTTHTGNAAPDDEMQWASGKWVSGEGNGEGGGQLFVVAACPTDNFEGPELFLWVIDNQKQQPPVEPDAAAMAEILTKKGRLALYSVNFVAGKADVVPDSAKSLEQIAALLKTGADKTLRLEVHSDNAGNAKTNLALSKKRAEAVKTWLTSKLEIAPERVVTDGLGDKKPVSPNSTDLGRANNRRIELSWVPPPAAP